MIISLILTLLASTSQVPTKPVEHLEPYLVGISVADVGVSANWYETNLGFEVYRRMDLPEHGLKIVFMKSSTFRLELVEKTGAKPLEHFAPHLGDDVLVLGLKKIAFAVSDLDAAAAALKARKVRFVVEPFDDPPMKLRSFIVADPDGNPVQFVQEMN